MEYLWSVVVFAVVSSATPGPNNLMVMTSGVNFGVKRSLPLLAGICIGFSFMLFLMGIGLGQVFVMFPNLQLGLKVLGTSYLLYLSWLIASAEGTGSGDKQTKPLGFLKGAMFQWVNAKAWVVALGAVTAFMQGSDVNYLAQALLITAVFFIASFPSVGVWLWFGSKMTKLLKSEKQRRAFNISMALLLVWSIYPVVRELIALIWPA
ncbi:LysE family translocator [Thaumasiovibrio subtropicus]|uniref:LysE family translocator n=1 Tax=Thaumasiovibrio subtropicus TaxID=1891207 RepID=UPI000B3608FC|nr:LysE family translocator [Thaumasiovibrio subtropicus]